MNIDFTSLNDVYHLAMIIVGVGALIVSIVALSVSIKRGKRRDKTDYRRKK